MDGTAATDRTGAIQNTGVHIVAGKEAAGIFGAVQRAAFRRGALQFTDRGPTALQIAFLGAFAFEKTERVDTFQVRFIGILRHQMTNRSG